MEAGVRLRVDLAYDGTAFHGWARQPGLRTVQAEIEAALERVVRQPVGTVVAGRTDAGVHAGHQVIHLDIPHGALERLPGRSGREPGPALAHRLRGVLRHQGAEDIEILGARVAAPGFDARFSPLWRQYRYRIADEETPRDPLRRFETVPVRGVLDVDAMSRAAGELLGLHDFLSYCKPRPHATTIRELQRLDIARQDDGAVVARLRADAFCHHMVRSLMGALLRVGSGREEISWPAAVLARASREQAVEVAPARGLVLEAIGYPDDAELLARAEQTRARRSAESSD